MKAVLLDFDGVLTTDKGGSQSILNYLEQETGIPKKILEDAYYPYNKDLLDGKIVHQDMWEDFCCKLGTKIEYDMLRKAYQHTPLDMDMIEFAKELKKTTKVAMVTDNKCDRMDEIMDFYKLRSVFDVVSVSAMYHSGKESELIFELTIEALGVKPEECIFIDNTSKNLIAAKNLGMYTILFDDENRNITDFREQVEQLMKEKI